MNKDSLRNTDVEAKRLLADTDEPNAFECEQKMSGYLLFSVISAILASFVFGWNIGVINSPKDVISDCKIENYPSNTLPACLPMTQLEWSAVVAIFAVGGLFGGSLGGKFCKFLGRKNTIFYNNIITLSAGVLMAFSVNIWMFGLGRILVGFSSGIATGAVPMYVAEISPNRYRGAMGTLHQLAIVIAILCSQLLSLPLSTISGWRILMSLTIIPGALQMILFPFCVETPSYLASKGEISMAEKSLKRLRNSECVKDELDSILAAQVSTAEEANLSFVQLLRSSELRKALIIAVVAQLAQQLSGINGVLQFSSSIFEKIAPGQEKVFTVGIGVINLFSTVLAVLLMDRSGRRTLLLISQFGMAAISALVVVTSVVSWNLLTVALSKFYSVYHKLDLIRNFNSRHFCCCFCNWTWAYSMAYHA